MFGLGFIEIALIFILLICFVKPQDYKTLLIQFKKLKLSLDSLFQDLQQHIMLLDEDVTNEKSFTEKTDPSKKT